MFFKQRGKNLIGDKMERLKNTKGRLLGSDYGDTRTGLAVSDEVRFLANGIGYISVGGMRKTVDKVSEIAREQNAVGIVVGLPVNMNGSEGPRAEKARAFAAMLEEASSLPVVLMDERMTTMAASRFLNETNTRGAKRKSVIDTLSAQIILQNTLDRLKNM